MKKIDNAIVLKNQCISNGIYDMTIKAPAVAQAAAAGQFVEIYPDNGVNLLPRPISICEIDKDNGTLRIVFQVVGKGTNLFSKLSENDEIRVMGPCGNGYTLHQDCEHILVGGGIGVPPLLETVKNLKGKKTVILGFRSGSFLVDEFKKYADVHVATDDGSVGFKGNVVELMKSLDINGDVIYSCGPKIMLKFLSQYAQEKNIVCQVSMEERMACGIGACVGCVIKIKEGSQWTYKKVCKDGPVFDACEVIWND